MASGQQSRSGLGWAGGMAPGSLWPDSLDSNNQWEQGLCKAAPPVNYTGAWQTGSTHRPVHVGARPPPRVTSGDCGEIKAHAVRWKCPGPTRPVPTVGTKTLALKGLHVGSMGVREKHKHSVIRRQSSEDTAKAHPLDPF